jgi:NhaA family Na+:H+ antiporter
MATDIAFALGALSLLGNRIPFSIKIFLTALAVIDDLAAIVVIALFYSKGIVWTNLLISLALFGVLLTFNKLKIKNLWVYMSVGIAMWYFMHHSGIHATITGVLLAFAIPANHSEHKSPSAKLERILQQPVPYFILPIFAMANTAIIIESNWSEFLLANYSKGIFIGLVLGKPIGITLFTFIAVKLGICELPKNISWTELFGVAILGGIGFTMSIFVTLLAFDDAQIINNSKFVILLSSLCAGIIGYIWLRIVLIGHKSLDS